MTWSILLDLVRHMDGSTWSMLYDSKSHHSWFDINEWTRIGTAIRMRQASCIRASQFGVHIHDEDKIVKCIRPVNFRMLLELSLLLLQLASMIWNLVARVLPELLLSQGQSLGWVRICTRLNCWDCDWDDEVSAGNVAEEASLLISLKLQPSWSRVDEIDWSKSPI